MDSGAYRALQLIGPKIPFILKTIAAHSLSFSPSASYWDLRTELTIRVVRELLAHGPPTSISKQQKGSLRDPGIKGNIWVSKTTLSIPAEDDARQLLFKAIDELQEEAITYKQPQYHAVEAEWTGFRSDAKPNSPPPEIGEQEKYDQMMKEVTGSTVLLHFHGGAYYLLDPAYYRQFAGKFGKLTGGRVFNVRYRLAPQNPFPAAILDALLSYLSVLYPPPGSPHKAVRAQDVVFGGDSAGGNLATVLLVFILHLHQQSWGKTPTIKFHGQTVEIPLPAGVAARSPWIDISRGMPSITAHLDTDYLPPPQLERAHTENTPDCAVWPADPPRVLVYCEGNAMIHPLTSPVMHRNWKDCPPMYFVCGEEMLEDEARVVAQRVARQGGKMEFDFFEKMPHVFSMILEQLPAAKMCDERYARWCKTAVEDPGALKTVGCSIAPKTLEQKPLDVENLTDLTDERVIELMKVAQREQTQKFEEAQNRRASRL